MRTRCAICPWFHHTAPPSSSNSPRLVLGHWKSCPILNNGCVHIDIDPANSLHAGTNYLSHTTIGRCLCLPMDLKAQRPRRLDTLRWRRTRSVRCNNVGVCSVLSFEVSYTSLRSTPILRGRFLVESDDSLWRAFHDAAICTGRHQML